MGLSAKERLDKLLSFLLLNHNSFGRAIGLDRPQNLYDIDKGKIHNISLGLASRIIDAFPGINKKWLLTGEGEMEEEYTLISTEEQAINDVQLSMRKGEGFHFRGISPNDFVGTNGKAPSVSKRRGVPYYDIDFIGGFDLVLNDQKINPDFYIDFMPFNDADYWVNISGKSMGPLIAHGDLIALKSVPDWQKFLLEGEIYAIITENGFRTVKTLSKGKDDDHYMLRPYNKSIEFNPQSIPKNIITHVFRVKGAIKKFF